MRKLNTSNNQKSLKNQIWQKKNFNPNLKAEIQEDLNCSNLIAELLAMRFDNLTKVQNYVQPTLKNNMEDPYNLNYLHEITDIIIDAINNNKKIAIFGDYDVDGATSSALLKNYFRELNIESRIYIPDRIEEGYGPNTNAFKILKTDNYDLVITVDCGATAFEPILEGKKMGLEIIVIDHHIASGIKPEALAIINPNQDDDNSNYGYLCAAGVCFLVLVALHRKLKDLGYFNDKKEPNLLEFLDIVALGTICDVVPLINLNRAFIAGGLKKMRSNPSPGIKALAATASLDLKEIESYHLGFILGPRINAGGRVGEASLGAKLLSETNLEKSYEIAAKLEIHNQERKAIEMQVEQEAFAMIEKNKLAENSIIICHNLEYNYWHPGVIGIVAARIKEKYNLPTAVISFDGEIGKASARSINGVDLGRAIIKAREENLLVNGGGHAMAAGFTITSEYLAEFSNYINKLLKEETEQALKNQIIEYDYDFAISALNTDLYHKIKILAPYGAQNAEPKFMLSNCSIIHKKIMAEKHLKLIISDMSSGIYGSKIEAILWKATDSIFLDYINKNPEESYSFLGSLQINKWQERECVQFIIEDIKAE
jgi:single-stranded-DNA-specific exonuclease